MQFFFLRNKLNTYEIYWVLFRFYVNIIISTITLLTENNNFKTRHYIHRYTPKNIKINHELFFSLKIKTRLYQSCGVYKILIINKNVRNNYFEISLYRNRTDFIIMRNKSDYNAGTKFMHLFYISYLSSKHVQVQSIILMS